MMMATVAGSASDIANANVSRQRILKDILPRPGSILLGEDEHLVAEGVAAHLVELGHQVVGPAYDGDMVMELARKQVPDLALLDIRLPKKSGLDAAEEIFESYGIPVVIFSAYSTEEYIDHSARAGVFGYLLKPVTIDQLRAGISVAWGRYVQHCEQHREIGALQERLEQRKVIEHAKWILVQHKKVTEPEAMRALQQQARSNRRKLIEVAQAVIDNDGVMNGG